MQQHLLTIMFPVASMAVIMSLSPTLHKWNSIRSIKMADRVGTMMGAHHAHHQAALLKSLAERMRRCLWSLYCSSYSRASFTPSMQVSLWVLSMGAALLAAPPLYDLAACQPFSAADFCVFTSLQGFSLQAFSLAIALALTWSCPTVYFLIL